MIVLVCGSRDWTDIPAIRHAIDKLPAGTIVIHGGARGADRIAGQLATERGLFVCEMPVKDEHWGLYGHGAGPARNRAMLDLRPDTVIAFQSNGSRGTQHTINEARARGITVEVHGS